jgi:hypothetical protein
MSLRTLSRGTAAAAAMVLFLIAFPGASGRFAPRALAGGNESERIPMIFASYAADAEQLAHTLILAESIREFSGGKKDAPVWVFVPKEIADNAPGPRAKADTLRVDLVMIEVPENASGFPFAEKVYAAAAAEERAQGRAGILAWLDEDTIVLKEPGEFALAPGVSFGYRPVMHQRIGSLFDEPVDAFWGRVYELLSVPEKAVFPVTTPADGKKIRAYFNAGVLVVRPERGLLRKWAESFTILLGDADLRKMCGEDVLKTVFLHQAALAGAVLAAIGKDAMIEFSERINYPLFFNEKFESDREFYSIEDAVTIRYDVYFRNPRPGWSARIEGPPEQAAWLKSRFGGD